MNLNLNLDSPLRVLILDLISDLFTLRKLGELFTLSSGLPSLADLPVRTTQRCRSAAAVHFYGCTALKRL